MTYMFMSFGDLHTRKNIGCCIVRVESPQDANEACKKLGLMPPTCNEARGYIISDTEFTKQGMELNKFYDRDKMMKMGFRTDI